MRQGLRNRSSRSFPISIFSGFKDNHLPGCVWDDSGGEAVTAAVLPREVAARETATSGRGEGGVIDGRPTVISSAVTARDACRFAIIVDARGLSGFGRTSCPAASPSRHFAFLRQIASPTLGEFREDTVCRAHPSESLVASRVLSAGARFDDAFGVDCRDRSGCRKRACDCLGGDGGSGFLPRLLPCLCLAVPVLLVDLPALVRRAARGGTGKSVC